MDIEMEDYPKGFFGTGNWEEVGEHLRLWGVRTVTYGPGANRWIGVSIKDDLEDPQTVAERAQLKAIRNRKYREQVSKDEEKRQQTLAARRASYAKLSLTPEAIEKRRARDRDAYTKAKRRARARATV